ncbi:MAG: XTP/dITP diphosphatase [Lachnospiraceae bacterium]|nr:XTP/dITP diphosphatase [Lachnospiraceae bacterium]
MMRKIIFATGNAGKMREIRDILKETDVQILSMKEAGIDIDIVEDGTTFEENAVIKAKAVARILQGHDDGTYRNAVVLADDSGLEIDYLNKEPGIYSARYLGEDMPYSVKNKNLIERLTGVPDEKRTARFVCAIAAALPGGEVVTTRGVIEGRIDYQEKGDNGFGYDPIFYVPEYGCTTAQLSEKEKNQISHRCRALEAMKKELKKRI